MFSMGCGMLLLRLERHSWSPKKKNIVFFFNLIFLQLYHFDNKKPDLDWDSPKSLDPEILALITLVFCC
jgi:hypothetical protein